MPLDIFKMRQRVKHRWKSTKTCAVVYCTSMTVEYLQNIGDHAQGPHVGAVTDGLKVDHFRSHKLRGAKQNLEKNWFSSCFFYCSKYTVYLCNIPPLLPEVSSWPQTSWPDRSQLSWSCFQTWSNTGCSRATNKQVYICNKTKKSVFPTPSWVMFLWGWVLSIP